MNRVDANFNRIRSRGARAIVPFVVAGHPDDAACATVIETLARRRVPVIEIGVPFSDPIADGPVITAAMKRSIDAGTTPMKVFELVRRVRARVEAGIVLMVSASIVVRMGEMAFVSDASDCGVDGLVVPDLDLDAAPAFAGLCSARGLALSMLVAPATGPERLRRIVASSSGFIYLLARQGVTGSAPSNDTPSGRFGDDLAARVRDLKAISPLPIACGFGISTAEQVAATVLHADAAIVGSAFVRALNGAATAEEASARTNALMDQLEAGLPAVRASAV